MFKFIHAADIHLDSPLRGLERYEGAPVEEIRGATRQALEKLVELAIGQEVDFVLIVGDLYDGDVDDFETGLFFVKQMARLREADIRVFILRGNHDAASKMTKSLPLPSNVRMLDHKKVDSVPLEDLGVVITGQSFAKRAETRNLALDYPPARGGLFHIGMLHTSLTGAEGHEPYAPCTVEELRSKGYDYWALGHVHQRDDSTLDPPIIFPGNIQGRHIRETGPKGCMVVSVDDRGKPTLRFHPLDVLRWYDCKLDASGAEQMDDILELFSHRLIRLMNENDGMPLAIRVELTGRCPFHRQLAADPIAWTNQIRATALDMAGGSVWIEKVQIHTSAPRPTDDSALDDSPVAMLTKLIDELLDDPELLWQLGEEELADLHRKMPDELQSGPDAYTEDDPDQLRQVLNQVEQLLLKRLL